MINIKELEKLIEDEDFKYIFLDVDGVVFHSIEAIVKILNKEYNMNVDPRDVLSWNFSNCYSEMTDKKIEQLFGTTTFFNNVKMIKGAKEFILKHIDKVILITKGGQENINRKRNYFDLNDLGKVRMVGIPLDMSKNIINMTNSLFIDDSTNNLNDVLTAKYKIQFIEYGEHIANKCAWTKGWDGERMESWV